MALEILKLDAPKVEQPDHIKRLIEEARLRIDSFVEGRGDHPLAGFVPSDFDEVYDMLYRLAMDRDGCFVEWGAGFGVATMLAASLGFDAQGIEIQADLVAEAERLAKDFEIDAEFVIASYVPAEAQELIDFTEGPDWLEPGGQNGHDLLDIDPADIDIVFAYPWPGESEVIEAIFERLCSPGALLFTWNNLEGMKIMRHRNQLR